MGALIVGLALICSLISLGCWIYTIVRAFQSGDTVAGIVSICPLGAFILGWINVSKWDHSAVMTIWTIVFVINVILNVVAAGMQAQGG